MIAPVKRAIIVTGASSGIGRAFTLLAARDGAAIFGVARNTEKLASLAERVRSQGGAIETYAADVSDPGTSKPIVARALAAFGRIDVVFTCAGEVAAGPLLAQRDADVIRQFGTHVVGPLALIRDALPALHDSKGHAIVVGSGVARVPVGGLGAYPASKAALRSAAATLRRELQPLGIALTYVDPGAVDTGFMERGGMASAPKWIMASPEHVARAVLRALTTRPRELNAVPYQTMFVALAERFPRLTDALLARVPSLVGGPLESEPLAMTGQSETNAGDSAEATTPQPEATADDPFDVALEPVARRMERLKLSHDFVRALLVPDATLALGDVAVRWAGMPNKNERAVLRDVMETLASAGYLTRSGEDRWVVVRSAG